MNLGGLFQNDDRSDYIKFMCFSSFPLHSPDIHAQQAIPTVVASPQQIQQSASTLTAGGQQSSGMITVAGNQPVRPNVQGQQMFATQQLQTAPPAGTTTAPPVQVEQTSPLQFFGGYRTGATPTDQSSTSAAGASGDTAPETASGVSFRSLCALRQNL